jgi:NAD(P)-dependent dehydrogenase (short-subunit alcohol dehydrogenase family)
MYRQSHILSKTLLKAVLKREREYLAEIEEVLEECVRKNYFRNLNPRIISNLITIMVDALVLKRWDLKDHSIAQELESSIFDLIFDGLSQKKRMEESRAAEPELEQKSALVITAEPLVGKEIASFLLSRGLALSIYSEHHRQKKDFLDVDKEGAPIRFYTREESGPMSGALLGDILRSSGPFDFLIFGLGPDCRTLDYDTQQYLGEKLTGKIHSVNSLEPVIEDAVRSGGGFRRIVYIGPSAWNRILDPIHYDLARAGAIAATRRQSRSMAAWQVSVNCIMPGFVLDDRVFGSTEETIAQVMEQIPFGRMGRIEDIATTVFFLLRDAPDYMTGQVLEMGGG